MQCPRCKAYGLSCTDSRTDGETIRRRRRCLNCGYRFTTYEISAEDYRKLKGEVEGTEALITDMLSYLDEFYKKVSERENKQHGNNQSEISSGYQEN